MMPRRMSSYARPTAAEWRLRNGGSREIAIMTHIEQLEARVDTWTAKSQALTAATQHCSSVHCVCIRPAPPSADSKPKTSCELKQMYEAYLVDIQSKITWLKKGIDSTAGERSRSRRQSRSPRSPRRSGIPEVRVATSTMLSASVGTTTVAEVASEEDDADLAIVAAVVHDRCWLCKGAAIDSSSSPSPASWLLCASCSTYADPLARSSLLSKLREAPVTRDPFADSQVTEHKKRVNADLVSLMEESGLIKARSSSVRALCLDSGSLHTCTWWISNLGLTPSMITVPNVFLYRSIREYQLTQQTVSTVHIKDTLVYDAIAEQRTEEPWTLVFLDYCCTISGNKHTKPLLDIDLLFRRRLIDPRGCLLAVSFSYRDASRPDLRPRQKQHDILQRICEIGAQHKYHLVPSGKSDCYPQMYVCIFEIRSHED